MTFARKPYSISNPGGVGIDERQIHIASGLRTASMSGVLAPDPDAIVDAADPADNTDWTAFTLTSSRMIFPCTPVITITHGNASPAAHTFRFRLKGYDQFGTAIQEILPPITTAPTDQNDVSKQVCSKVFSYITEVAYQLSGDQASTTVDVGWDFIWDEETFELEDGGDSEIFGAANIGIGSPLKLSPYGPNLGAVQDPNAAAGIYHPEVLSLVCVNHSQSDAVVAVPARPGTALANEGFQVGVNVAGYEGTAHKVSIYLAATSGTGTFATTGGGTDDLAHADTISFVMDIWSSVGTGRVSSPRSSYVR